MAEKRRKKAAQEPVKRRKKKPAEAPDKKRRKKKPSSQKAVAEGITEIPGFPRSEGPPPIKNGEGGKALSEHGAVRIVDMDEGAFRWLWEAAESRALSDYRKYRKSVPSIPDAGTRALTALRATGKSKKQDAKKGRRRKIK